MARYTLQRFRDDSAQPGISYMFSASFARILARHPRSCPVAYARRGGGRGVEKLLQFRSNSNIITFEDLRIRKEYHEKANPGTLRRRTCHLARFVEQQPRHRQGHTRRDQRRSQTARVVTTTAKLLQIMMGKGLVTRDESTWPHTYVPAVARAAIQRNVVARTVTELFDKSAGQFILAALESGAPSQTKSMRSRP